MIADPNALLAAVQAQAAGQAGQASPQAQAAPLASATEDLAVLASRYSAGAAEGAAGAAANRDAAKSVSDKNAADTTALYASRQQTAGVEVGAARSRAAATAATSKANLETDRIQGQISMLNLQRQIKEDAEREIAKDVDQREALAERRQFEFQGNIYDRYGPRFQEAFKTLLTGARENGRPAISAAQDVDRLLRLPEFAGVSKDYLVEELARFDRYVEGDQDDALGGAMHRAPVRQLAAGAPASTGHTSSRRVDFMGLAKRILPY